MCGICGEITFDGSPASAVAVERLADAMAERGPDDCGIVQRGRIALGARRLSIIDLSSMAAQPMTDFELGLDGVFNGCILNYRELRAELEQNGYRFVSNGDTEVVLKSHHRWGTEAPRRFRGMFAYAIVERDTGRPSLVAGR